MKIYKVASTCCLLILLSIGGKSFSAEMKETPPTTFASFFPTILDPSFTFQEEFSVQSSLQKAFLYPLFFGSSPSSEMNFLKIFIKQGVDDLSGKPGEKEVSPEKIFGDSNPMPDQLNNAAARYFKSTKVCCMDKCQQQQPSNPCDIQQDCRQDCCQCCDDNEDMIAGGGGGFSDIGGGGGGWGGFGGFGGGGGGGIGGSSSNGGDEGGDSDNSSSDNSSGGTTHNGVITPEPSIYMILGTGMLVAFIVQQIRQRKQSVEKD